MFSLIKNQFTVRVFTAPRFATVAPLAAQFSNSAINFATKTSAKKKPATKKPAATKAPAKAAAKKPVKKVSVKRVVPPFMFYVKDSFAQNGAELKAYPFGDRVKLLWERWNNMSESEKAPYEAQTETDVQRYEAEKALEKERAPPKRPLTAFLAWYIKEREVLKSSNPDASIAELGKLAGQKWATLHHTEKQPFVDAFKPQMEEWKVQYAKWKLAQAQS